MIRICISILTHVYVLFLPSQNLFFLTENKEFNTKLCFWNFIRCEKLFQLVVVLLSYFCLCTLPWHNVVQQNEKYRWDTLIHSPSSPLPCFFFLFLVSQSYKRHFSHSTVLHCVIQECKDRTGKESTTGWAWWYTSNATCQDQGRWKVIILHVVCCHC